MKGFNWVMLGFFIVGCGDGEKADGDSAAPVVGDADADTDADADADADTDADTDADADADADVDADSDTDTGDDTAVSVDTASDPDTASAVDTATPTDTAVDPDTASPLDTADETDTGADTGIEDSGGPPADPDLDGDGFTLLSGDCDDLDPGVYPGAVEVCDAGRDNDCNGLADDADPGVDESTMTSWYRDADSDGYGLEAFTLRTCAGPAGFVDADPAGFDCDDDDPAFHPGAVEDDCADPSDYNCDGSVVYADDDDDGWAACEDCDDLDALASPDGTEVCDDGRDNDCNDLADDDDPGVDPDTLLVWYADADEDGYGSESDWSLSCEMPAGHVAEDPSGFDCDDADAAFHPGALEDDCEDPADYDCDGIVAYEDADGDGWPACEDCDDEDETVNPDATEVCDGGLDNDCNDLADDDDPGLELVTRSTWYRDEDGDTYGDPFEDVFYCAVPDGYVHRADDCDDTDDEVHPDATEVCNGVDDNCNGYTDDDDLTLSPDATTVWYIDYDSDGFGSELFTTRSCTAASGFVADATDCDDTEASVHPDGIEVCDASDADEDCDGAADDADAEGAVGKTTAYRDADGDAYGDASDAMDYCDIPSSHVTDSTDCDDSRADVNPSRTEVCDEADADEDCDGAADDGDVDGAEGKTTAYRDADGDAYGDASDAMDYCDIPSSHSTDATDCDDTRSDVNPGQAELCDASDLDEDCDGAADDADEGGADGKVTRYPDEDSDGYGRSSHGGTAYCDPPSDWVADSSDCDDDRSDVHPGASEVCDAGNTDEDCDGAADDADGSASGKSTYYRDVDGDGYGISVTASYCDPPGGWASRAGDCEDSLSAVNPGVTAWFTTDRGDGSFDYDCDGEETWEVTKVCNWITGYCEVGGFVCSFYGVGGWPPAPPYYGCRVEDLPDCGETGSIVIFTDTDDMGEIEVVRTEEAVQGCH